MRPHQAPTPSLAHPARPGPWSWRWPRSPCRPRASSPPTWCWSRSSAPPLSTSAPTSVDPRRRLRRAARRGHDPHPRRRAPARRHQHQDRRRDRHRHPARLLRADPGSRQRPGQRGALLRRPAAARRDGRRPDRHPARLRLRHPLQEVPGDGRRASAASTSTTRWRSATPTSSTEGFKKGRIRLGGYNALAYARIRKNLPGGDFDRSANQQRILRGIQAKIREKAGQPRFPRARRDQRHGRTWTPTPPRRSCSGSRRRSRMCEPQQDHDLRGAGRDRQHRAAPASCCPTSTRPARYGDDARDDATISRLLTGPDPHHDGDGARRVRVPVHAQGGLDARCSGTSAGTPRSCSASRRG